MIDLIRDLLSWAAILSGSLFILVGTLGLLRLPDVFTRLHGIGMTDTLGAGLLILGMLLQTDSWLVAVKLILIVVFLFFTSPTTSHALANAAHHAGLKPWSKPAKPAPSEEGDIS